MTRSLTKTQRFILAAADASSTGTVGFAAGDRHGTRIGRTDELGRPWIVAYQSPEWHLVGRGLLEKANEPHVYSITPSGRSARRAGRG